MRDVLRIKRGLGKRAELNHPGVLVQPADSQINLYVKGVPENTI